MLKALGSFIKFNRYTISLLLLVLAIHFLAQIWDTYAQKEQQLVDQNTSLLERASTLEANLSKALSANKQLDASLDALESELEQARSQIQLDRAGDQALIDLQAVFDAGQDALATVFQSDGTCTQTFTSDPLIAELEQQLNCTLGSPLCAKVSK